MGERRYARRVLKGKPEGTSPAGRPQHRWEDNFKMDLQVVGWEGMDWNDLAHDRDWCQVLMNTAINPWVS
jgi:hypothetical protein